MKNLTIRARLLLGFALVVVLEIATILYFATILYSVNQQVGGLIGIENLVEADRDAYQSHVAFSYLVSGLGMNGDEAVNKTKEAVTGNHAQIDERFTAFKKAYKSEDPAFKEKVALFAPAYQKLTDVNKKLLGLVDAKSPEASAVFLAEYSPAFSDMRTVIDEITTITYTKAIEDNASVAVIIDNINWFVIIGLLLLASITIGLALIITRSISSQINLAIRELASSSRQISTASSQLARSSQEIANGAIEQASSIEETSASIEELASMVKQNASNSRETSALADKTVDVADNGYTQMERMLESMKAISTESGRIKKIMKVIDDIAFQTNILALNAAVEAARAGDAGMGFAVVAEEVKNLANRSADAAKETADMIESSILKTAEGLVIAENMSVQFKDVQEKARKLAIMGREVETASRQQDIGIEQVNKAIVQFDEVVQANAGSAEETASAATELQTQVEALDDLVGQLTAVVLGRAAANNRKQWQDAVTKQEQQEEKSRSGSQGRASSRQSGNQEWAASPTKKTGIKKDDGATDRQDTEKSAKESRPEKMIPFEDDEDLKEF